MAARMSHGRSINAVVPPPSPHTAPRAHRRARGCQRPKGHGQRLTLASPARRCRCAAGGPRQRCLRPAARERRRGRGQPRARRTRDHDRAAGTRAAQRPSPPALPRQTCVRLLGQSGLAGRTSTASHSIVQGQGERSAQKQSPSLGLGDGVVENTECACPCSR